MMILQEVRIGVSTYSQNNWLCNTKTLKSDCLRICSN